MLFHHRSLAAAVGAGDGDQLSAIGEALEVKRQRVAAQTIADAAEALESEPDWLHGARPGDLVDTVPRGLVPSQVRRSGGQQGRREQPATG